MGKRINECGADIRGQAFVDGSPSNTITAGNSTMVYFGIVVMARALFARSNPLVTGRLLTLSREGIASATTRASLGVALSPPRHDRGQAI
jgi:hypothetical protein